MSKEDLKIKTAADKVPLNLMPLWVHLGEARVFGYGAKKYEPGNWLLAADPDAPGRYLAAAFRHLMEVQQNPQSLDTESGLPHLDHALCSLAMLRGLLIRYHGMPVDPGEGLEPPVPPPPKPPAALALVPPPLPASYGDVSCTPGTRYTCVVDGKRLVVKVVLGNGGPKCQGAPEILAGRTVEIHPNGLRVRPKGQNWGWVKGFPYLVVVEEESKAA